MKLEGIEKLLEEARERLNLSVFGPEGDSRSESFLELARFLSRLLPDKIKRRLSESHGEPLPFWAIATGDRPRHFYQAFPYGMEEKPFHALIATLIMRKHALSPQSLRILEKIEHPLTIRVLITPTCPFCPRMVRLVNQIAAFCPLISAWIIDLDLYPEKRQQYRPTAAPTTILGENVRLTGLIPENELIHWLQKLDTQDYLEDLYRNDLLEKRMDSAVKRLSLRPQDMRIMAVLLKAEEFAVKLGAMAVIEQLIEDVPQHQGIVLENLRPLLQDNSDQMVGDTAYLIGLLQDHWKTGILTSLLSHPNPEVVEAARDGLAGNPFFLNPLLPNKKKIHCIDKKN